MAYQGNAAVNAIKVYMLPFDIYGEYVDTWIEITKYVKSIGNITTDVDSSDYQIGVYKNSSVNITLNNREGLFSDVDIFQSIFKYKRTDTQVKITYSKMDNIPECGAMEVGNFFLSTELEIFRGLLNDASYRFNAQSEDASFTILGLESLLDKAIVPLASLADGDSIQEIIYDCLNQAPITDLLTVTLTNIVPGIDQDADDVSFLENMTVREALDKLLLVSNSVLYISNQIIYVTNRDESATLEYTFYGQASQLGPENIINITNYNNGLNRIFNYFYWKDSSHISYDIDSRNLNGTRSKEIDFAVYTGSAKRVTMMNDLVDEYKDKKIEMELSTPMSYSTLDLNLKDKVNIDYPTVYYATEFNLPICGAAICGNSTTATLPRGFWSLVINTLTYFKILKKTYDLKQLLITFKLREV